MKVVESQPERVPPLEKWFAGIRYGSLASGDRSYVVNPLQRVTPLDILRLSNEICQVHRLTSQVQ